MPRSKPKKAYSKAADEHLRWHDPRWDHDDAACDHALKLLKRRGMGLHRLTDPLRGLRRWLSESAWIRRLAIIVAVFGVLSAAGFGALWLRLEPGRSILMSSRHGSHLRSNRIWDTTTPLRSGALRLSELDGFASPSGSETFWCEIAITTSSPARRKPKSGCPAWPFSWGNSRAETLRLVGAELSVRITPDGRVIVSTGQSN